MKPTPLKEKISRKPHSPPRPNRKTNQELVKEIMRRDHEALKRLAKR